MTQVKNKIKVLRILNRFNVGGPIFNVTYLTKYINPDLYQTLLIGGQCEKHEQSAHFILDEEGVAFKELKYMRRAISPFFDLISLFQIILIIYKFKPNIIHTHAAKAGLLGRVASLFYFGKISVIHTYHGNVFDGYFSRIKNYFILKIEQILARVSTKIVAISNLQKQDLVNKYKICPNSKIQVIPLGFDLTKFTAMMDSKRQETRHEFNLADEIILITIIGRVVPVKNHKLFIDVINYCKNKSIYDIRALVVGDGSLMNEIIDYTKTLGLKPLYKEVNDKADVLFTSWRSDIDRILAASDIVCLTSLNEGTPVSIIESMASKTASISTNVGGVSDIINHRVSGIVSDSEVKVYAENLLELINNKELRASISEKGQKTSLESFNYDVLVKNMESLYKTIIED